MNLAEGPEVTKATAISNVGLISISASGTVPFISFEASGEFLIAVAEGACF